MAEFFLSIPGGVTLAGLGLLLLTRNRRPPRTRAARADHARTLQAIVSLAVLGAALWVLVSGRYGAAAQRWAAGSIGTVVGYWLKP